MKKSRKAKGTDNSMINTTPLFGTPLSTENEERACIFVETCIEFLYSKGLENLQGLFRLCGSKLEIDTLREQANLGDIFQFEITEEQEPHSVAGVLKQYFRELPEPLVPYEQYAQFITVSTLNRSEHSPTLIKNCISMLPPTNRYIMGKILNFSHEVQSHKSRNLMSSDNLATCIGPNFIRTPDGDLCKMIIDTPAIMSLFSLLIQEAPTYFSDAESYRPTVRRKSEANKHMFTVHFSQTDKKTIVLNPGDMLCSTLEKICLNRNIILETLPVYDGLHCPVPLMNSLTLSDIEGRCVYLFYPGVEVEHKPDIPKIFHTDFIYSEHERDKSNSSRSKSSTSIGKSLSSSKIPRSLTPRNDKVEKTEKLEKSPSISENEIIYVEPLSSSGQHHYLNKDEKRKSWKALTKKTSEINTKGGLQTKRTKSDLQVPVLQTSLVTNRKPLSESDRTKSDVQVPVVVSPIAAKEQSKPQKTLESTKRAKSRSVKQSWKLNTKENQYIV
jgi:hypothetical protein